MKTPRDGGAFAYLRGRVFANANNLGIGICTNDGGRGVLLTKNEFDALVDWYIGADAIRKYVAEHEKEKARPKIYVR